jgi:RNA recognition motif-containing protein
MELRVKNLDSEVNMGDIQKQFGKYGKVVSVSLISDPGAPFGTRHVAFIEMPLREEGLSAIHTLNGTLMKNLPIEVTETTNHKP